MRSPDCLEQTAAEIAAEIPRYSWELMDEDQRDDLMKKVVLPRYMKETADGVTLGPTWWARALGATEPAVRNRFQRLQAKNSESEGRSRSGPSTNEKASVRSAKAAMRKHPELAGELLGDPDVADAVLDAAASNPKLTAQIIERAEEKRPAPAKPSRDPLPIEAAAAIGVGAELLNYVERRTPDIDTLVAWLRDESIRQDDASLRAIAEDIANLKEAGDRLHMRAEELGVAIEGGVSDERLAQFMGGAA